MLHSQESNQFLADKTLTNGNNAMEALQTSSLTLNYQHINSEKVYKNIVMEYQQISNLLTTDMLSIYNLLFKKAKLISFL